MQRAIELALLAEQEGNLPVGAVITLGDDIVSEGRSAIWHPHFDATRHAEMEALRTVPQEQWESVGKLSLFTTLEPCLMCFGSILLHGITRVVFGASDPYGGASPVFSQLPPFFLQRYKQMEWVGPIAEETCNPLHHRLRVIEETRAGKA
jgi:tRNA(adenine34) deaminase